MPEKLVLPRWSIKPRHFPGSAHQSLSLPNCWPICTSGVLSLLINHLYLSGHKNLESWGHFLQAPVHSYSGKKGHKIPHGSRLSLHSFSVLCRLPRGDSGAVTFLPLPQPSSSLPRGPWGGLGEGEELDAYLKVDTQRLSFCSHLLLRSPEGWGVLLLFVMFLELWRKRTK